MTETIGSLKAELADLQRHANDLHRTLAAVVLAGGGKVEVPRDLLVEMPHNPAMHWWDDYNTGSKVVAVARTWTTR